MQSNASFCSVFIFKFLVPTKLPTGINGKLLAGQALRSIEGSPGGENEGSSSVFRCLPIVQLDSDVFYVYFTEFEIGQNSFAYCKGYILFTHQKTFATVNIAASINSVAKVKDMNFIEKGGRHRYTVSTLFQYSILITSTTGKAPPRPHLIGMTHRVYSGGKKCTGMFIVCTQKTFI